MNAEEADRAWRWWRALSINEMKHLAAKHFPALRLDTVDNRRATWVLDIYRAEVPQ